MRFALRSSQKELQDGTVVFYFFNARGVELERSVEGMYRTLICQLLEKAPHCAAITESLQWPRRRLGELSLDFLKDIFSSVVARLGDCSLTCFIDALDECDEDEVRDMVAYFEELGDLAANDRIELNICFSSRHYPHISINKAVHLTLEDQAEHQEDIKKYIKSKLRIGSSKNAQEIKAQVERRASGIFLWVCLVVRMLNKDYDHGNIHNLQKRLEEIPDKLDDLFRAIIHDGSRNSSTLVTTLQWILFAKKPLKCEELYFAIQSSRGEDTVTAWDRDELTVQDMQRSLLNSSRGLAEITRGKNRIVQFIHESVRHFISGERGLPEIEQRLLGNLTGLSHDKLRHCCQTYLSTSLDTNNTARDDISRFTSQIPGSKICVSERYPFLEYALTSLLFHADAAQKHEVQQHDFLKELDREKWDMVLSFEDWRTTTKAYIFADRSYNSLLEAEIQESSNFNFEDMLTAYVTPLGAAVSRGNEHGVRLLLRQGASPMSRARLTTTAFDLAIEKGHVTIFLEMLANGADVGVDSRVDGQRIYSAAIGGHDEIVNGICKRCKDLKADVRFDVIPRTRYGTALTAASAKGYVNTVKVLIEQGADVNCRSGGSGGYDTPLIAAACKGQAGVVELLLRHDAGLYHPALHAAVASNHVETVNLLIAYGASVNEHYSTEGTPLHLAADIDKIDAAIIELLLEKGADVNIQCLRFGAALHVASTRGHVEAAKLLLNNGAKVDRYHKRLGTPLHCAARRGSESVAVLLLRRGARVDHEGGYYGSALCAASAAGHRDLVEILLRNGADIELVPRYDNLPALLTDVGRPRWAGYSTDIWIPYPLPRRHGTALQVAASAGHKEVVELLLNFGANVNAANPFGKTALQIARANSQDEIASIFLEHGAVDDYPGS